jgi:xanthine dehydrogenase YagS FAD-binding subunit
MQAFEYTAPATTEDAVKLLGDEGKKSAVLAGGTDLLSLMKDFVVTPKRIVSIKSIKELQGIRYSPGKGLRIGALVTLDELLTDEKVKQEYPSLWQAAEGVRSSQIRSLGTVGGDLCQRPRCWYYRNGYGLLALRNGKSMVPEGDNRYHAILGNSGPAYFVSASSLAPVLIALGAKLKVVGPVGPRDLALEKFYVIPKMKKEKEYALANSEIMTEILVPPAKSRRNSTYEVRQREALDWPLAAAAVALKMSGNRVESARIVLGHVAPIPWVAPEAEKYLAGKTMTEEVAAQTGKAALQGAKPLSRNAYKIRLAQVAVKRALLRATGMEV